MKIEAIVDVSHLIINGKIEILVIGEDGKFYDAEIELEKLDWKCEE